MFKVCRSAGGATFIQLVGGLYLFHFLLCIFPVGGVLGSEAVSLLSCPSLSLFGVDRVIWSMENQGFARSEASQGDLEMVEPSSSLHAGVMDQLGKPQSGDGVSSSKGRL